MAVHYVKCLDSSVIQKRPDSSRKKSILSPRSRMPGCWWLKSSRSVRGGPQRTGTTWPLNVGQVYTTLTRLERDGLVEVVGHGGADDPAGTDASDRQVSYRATEAGRSEVSEWFATPVPRSQPPRDRKSTRLNSSHRT